MNPPRPTSPPGRLSTRHDPGPWIIGLLSLLLWWAGYPRPHVDDLFFTGTSIELARSGVLANPWLSTWLASLGTDRFFVFPPVLPYAQALWVLAFGVSTASFTAFHLAVQAALQICVYRLARRARGSVPAALATALVCGLFSINYGMRPDALALLLVVLGQIGAHGTRPWHWLTGAGLSAAAVLSHPLAVALVVPLYLGLLFFPVDRRPDRARWLGYSVAGVGLAFAGFLLSIRGELGEFLRVMEAHRALEMKPLWYLGPVYFLREFTFGKEPWLIGPVFLVIAASFARLFLGDPPTPHRRLFRHWHLVWLAAVLTGSFIYPGRMVQYSAYAGLVLAAVGWTGSRWSNRVAVLALATAMLHNAGTLLMPAFASRELPDVAAIRQFVREHPGDQLCVDEVAARHVFDFRLPPGTQNWLLRQAAQADQWGSLAAKPANEIWLVNDWKLERYVVDSGVEAQRLRVGPFTLNSIPQAPLHLRIIK